MRLGDDDHRARLARTRGGTLRLRSRTLRHGTVDGGRIAVAVMVVVMMMAADGRKGQGSGNQQGEEFTHGHVSFLLWGNVTVGLFFVFFVVFTH